MALARAGSNLTQWSIALGIRDPILTPDQAVPHNPNPERLGCHPPLASHHEHLRAGPLGMAISGSTTSWLRPRDIDGGLVLRATLRRTCFN